MTQARTPAGSSGSQYYVDSTQFPTALTWDAVPSVINKLRDGEVTYWHYDSASADFVWQIPAEENGFISGLIYGNGAVAMDSVVGWELSFQNASDSNTVLAYFGLGSGTEAAKASDVDTAVAASETTFISNTTSDSVTFNKGDVIKVTADRDGTTGWGNFGLVVQYHSEGR